MGLIRAILFFFENLFGNYKSKQGRNHTPHSSAHAWEDGADVPSDGIVTVVTAADLSSMQHVEEAGEIEPEAAQLSADTALETVENPKGAHVPRYMWLLDNGHGKASPGKRSPVLPDGRQLMEYEFNRDIVGRIMAGLDLLGIKYHNLVPEVEGDIELQTRVQRATAVVSALPKFYLSVHCNAAGATASWSPAEGFETWFYGASKKGLALASAFQAQLIKATGRKDRGVRFHFPLDHAFFVLRKTSMPAVLTENGFYTNLDETKRLFNPEFRQLIAKAHIDAIVEIERKGIDNITTYSKIQKIEKK